VAPVTAGQRGTAVAAATITPVDGSDTFTATSLDSGVAAVAGAVRIDASGRIEVDLTTGSAGSTSVLITHGNGDEFAGAP
jgi:hypothetical protein